MATVEGALFEVAAPSDGQTRLTATAQAIGRLIRRVDTYLGPSTEYIDRLDLRPPVEILITEPSYVLGKDISPGQLMIQSLALASDFNTARVMVPAADRYPR